MPSFIVASIVPALLTERAPTPEGVRIIRQLYITDASNDQAAIDLVANWDDEPTGTDYLAIPFNPKKPSN
jgi:hypothetical protein